ncbi:hypothetical protein GKC56_00410 [Neisseriaceae bacterium PsAf]|nr:hypothetical protein [Neisseriaceae bacterium PsAf]
MAKEGNETSFVKLSSALDLTGYQIKQENSYSAKQLFVFGARDLYRPNENIVLNALLRDSNGEPVKQQPIQLKIYDPENTLVKTLVLQPQNNEKGFYQVNYPLPNNAKTGTWEFEFEISSKQKTKQLIKVEDFLPERMALQIDTDEKPIVSNNEFNFNVKGWFYTVPQRMEMKYRAKRLLKI